MSDDNQQSTASSVLTNRDLLPTTPAGGEVSSGLKSRMDNRWSSVNKGYEWDKAWGGGSSLPTKGGVLEELCAVLRKKLKSYLKCGPVRGSGL